MVHRALLGSLERFIGILIEQYAGAFPLWLAPVQMKVLTITDRQNAYAQQVTQQLAAAGFRAEADLSNDKIGAKIRTSTMEKIPYVLVVGDKELDAGTVAVSKYPRENKGTPTLAEFIASALLELQTRG